MAVNLDRFKKDLDRLIAKADDLQFAMVIKAYGEKPARKLLLDQGIADEVITKGEKGAGTFEVDYQAWYSEGLAVLKQILPDRLAEFKALYERPSNRKEISYVSYVMADFVIGLQSSRGGDVIADKKSGIPKFQNQLAILISAQTRFSSSLYEIRQLVQADLFDSELDAARELLKNKFLRAAGAIAGVVLEKHLRQVCDDHSVNITKKNPSISDLNELLKAASVIDVPQWRHITLMGDYRNLCDHNKQKEPTADQVTELIDGTDKILKTIA